MRRRLTYALHTALETACERPAIPELDGRERAVFMGFFSQQTQVTHVTFVPEPRSDAGNVLGFGRNCAIFCTDYGEASFRFHGAVIGLEPRFLRTAAHAVTCLGKPVLEYLWPDLDGLEKNVMFGISWHCGAPEQH